MTNVVVVVLDGCVGCVELLCCGGTLLILVVDCGCIMMVNFLFVILEMTFLSL